jgi:uncharacterized DUF497 family protein
MTKYKWNPDKNELLKRMRGTSFEQVVLHIEQGDLIDIIDHPDQTKYRGQKILFVRIRNYMFAVPFIKDGDDWFLKTIMPSRKATKKYLEET